MYIILKYTDKNSKIYKILGYIAMAGNVVYFSWILYNGISEGFANIGTVQGVSFKIFDWLFDVIREIKAYLNQKIFDLAF